MRTTTAKLILLVWIGVPFWGGCDPVDQDAPKITVLNWPDYYKITGPLTLQVTVKDESAIELVYLAVNGEEVAWDNSEPYELFWDFDDIQSGEYELYIGAVDEYDNAGLSEQMTYMLVPSPLVGIWYLRGMSLSADYYMAQDAPEIGLYSGNHVGSGTISEYEFSALGVTMQIEFQRDSTYLLDGYLPVFNDTLGHAPLIIPLYDMGVFDYNSYLNWLTMSGSLLAIQGYISIETAVKPPLAELVSQTDFQHYYYIPVGGYGVLGPYAMDVYQDVYYRFEKQ